MSRLCNKIITIEYRKLRNSLKGASYFSLFMLLLFVANTHVVYAGFGISPPYLNNERLTRGSNFQQQIVLVRSDPDTDLNVEITMNVPGAQDWIAVDKGLKFVMHKGETQVPITFTVKVPANAEYKDYHGSIRVRTSYSGANQPAGGVSIALGAQIDVNMKIVDKIYDFDIRRVRLLDLEEGITRWGLFFPGKMRFLMTVHNTGNTDFGPTKVCFEIYDYTAENLLEKTCNTNRIEQIPPFATKEVVAELPTRLSTGSYIGKYTIYRNEEVAQQNQITVSIAAVGAVSGYEGYGFDGLSAPDKIKVIVVLAIPLLVLLILIASFIWRRKRRDQMPPRSYAANMR